MASPNAFPQSPQKSEPTSAPDLPNADPSVGAVPQEEKDAARATGQAQGDDSGSDSSSDSSGTGSRGDDKDK